MHGCSAFPKSLRPWESKRSVNCSSASDVVPGTFHKRPTEANDIPLGNGWHPHNPGGSGLVSGRDGIEIQV